MNQELFAKTVSASMSARQVCKTLSIPKSQFKRLATEYEVDFSHFCHGRTCIKMIDNKYGMLTVKEISNSGRRKMAKCQCDCGNFKIVRCDALTNGRAYSCGCHSKNRWNMVCGKNPAFKGVGEIRAAYFGELKHGASQRGLEFSLTMPYLWNLYEQQNRKCALTNLPICFGRIYVRHETTASLDRIDCKKGYIEGNVRWVLKDINMLRGDYDTEYFLQLCNAVAKANPR